MPEPVTLAHRTSPGNGIALVLDYETAPTCQWRRWGRKAHAAGPWIVWPSRWSWGWLALLIAAALWLSRMPRNWPVVSEFEGDDAALIPGTSRILYRAKDFTLRIREMRPYGGFFETQLQS